jgi:acetyl-CoA synthetase
MPQLLRNMAVMNKTAVMSETKDRYAEIYQDFRWHVPHEYNMAHVCCRRWAENPVTTKNRAVTLHYAAALGQKNIKSPAQSPLSLSYGELYKQANQFSGVLAGLGVKRGDKVAIILPQCLETAVAYMAVLQMGAVAVPLSQLFGVDALEYRLQDSGTVVAVVDESTAANVAAVRSRCPELRTVVGVGIGMAVGSAAGTADIQFASACAKMPATYTAAKTKAEDAAVLIYTSGTTGPPKGALIPHRALIGNLTGFVASQNWFGFDADVHAAGAVTHRRKTVFWSPADWAWTGGLMDALLPTLYFGKEIIAHHGRFSPEIAFDILQSHQVTHTFLFPTALKAMMKAFPKPREHFKLKLQAIMSAGEAVGDAVYTYCEQQLGTRVNEMFGQTEINYIVGNCNRYWPSKPGSMGKAYPGHWVAVINEASELCKPGEVGEVAVNHLDIHGTPDPVFFLGYWRNQSATEKKTTACKTGQRWCRTGDLAYADEEGYLWYQGRADDMFKAAGYRIGPSEVENCLVKHPAVLNAAVVPKPDKERGAVVKAYIVLTPEFVTKIATKNIANYLINKLAFDEKAAQELKKSIQAHVRGLLAPYEYPKEIEFIEALPMTTTGKVQRRVLRLQEEERARAV